MERLALRDIRPCAVEPRLFVVPENETDRTVGLDVRAAEHARQLHNECGTRAIVVGRLAPPVPIHVSADDIHLVRVRRADLRAVDFLSLAVGRRLRVERAQLRVLLREGVRVHAGVGADAA